MSPQGVGVAKKSATEGVRDAKKKCKACRCRRWWPNNAKRAEKGIKNVGNSAEEGVKKRC